ncbi:UDP-N-acetylmuramoyl-L-alanine--D-glutamate ligase [Vreelandella aquamarina]
MLRIPKGVTLVVGLGISGQAICRHLDRQGVPFVIADTRKQPPGLEAIQRLYPGVDIYCGPLTALDLHDAEEVVLSPGVDPRTPGLEPLHGQYNPKTGEPRIVGEIALFTRAAKAPIVAITGSNAKSTVTTLVGEMAKASAVNAAVGGNLGTAALDLLVESPEADFYILELSSFQLETTPSLGAYCSAFLNLSEDHLDRHAGMGAYAAAKRRVFINASRAVVNADQAVTWPEEGNFNPQVSYFTRHSPAENEWGLVLQNGDTLLMQGSDVWAKASELGLSGEHNLLNALAALAIGVHCGFSRSGMLHALRDFKGLKHRSERVASINDVLWINDSKGTNVGATLAAIQGIGPSLEGKLMLLAGGDGKGADFSPLAAPLARYARQVLLYGRDARLLDDALNKHVDTQCFDDLPGAMQAAYDLAQPGDCVLLSPACASLDQFKDYQQRGDVFCQWIEDRVSQAGGSQ